MQKIGISTYGVENLKFLQKKLKFDIIQTNGNI